MSLIVFKLLITPSLIVGADFIERRYGSKAAGMLIGLPLTSGPISFFLTNQYGPDFCSHAAVGAMAGTACGGIFCLVYAWCARSRSWPVSLIAALAAFLSVIALLPASALGIAGLLLLSPLLLGACWLKLRNMKEDDTGTASAAKARTPSWSLPLRAAIATAMVFALTSAAGWLGPQYSGLVSAFPVITALCASFTHASEGTAAVTDLLQGLTGGSLLTITFFAIVGTLVMSHSALLTYTLAIAGTMLLSLAVTLNKARVTAALRTS